MPWGVAAAAVSAGAGLYSSNKAAKGQQGAADAAMSEQQRQYDTTRNDNMTALNARNSALGSMQDLAGSYKPPTAADVMGTPGYQFGLTQGMQGVNNNASATGGLYSGNQLKAAGSYANDYATTKYDDALNNSRNAFNDQFNRYASISGQGQLGANAINSAGQNMANQNTNTLTSNGNAQGAAAIAQGNAIQNGVNGVGYGLKSWFSQPGQSYTSPGSNGSYANPSSMQNDGYNWSQQTPEAGGIMFRPSGGYADGGPVGVPVVGTRSPVRTSGNSPTGSQAILDSIIARRAKMMGVDSGVGSLVANPVTNPAAITADRVRDAEAHLAHGGAVHGPGGPRDDSIPARLSNGEHVMDAASVTALGDGDNALGQAKLNMLRSKLHGAC